MKIRVVIEIPAILLKGDSEVGIIKGGGEIMVTKVVELRPIIQDFKQFCENVVRDGLVYAPGYWVNSSYVKAIWIIE